MSNFMLMFFRYSQKKMRQKHSGLNAVLRSKPEINYEFEKVILAKGSINFFWRARLFRKDSVHINISKNKEVAAILNFDVGFETEFRRSISQVPKVMSNSNFSFWSLICILKNVQNFSNISIQICKRVAVLKWNYHIGKSILGIYKSLTDTWM